MADTPASAPVPGPVPGAAPEPVAPKGRLRLVILVVIAVLVLGGGGAGTFWFLRHRSASTTVEATVEAKAPDAPQGILSLEPFVVNLADPGGDHFLRVTVRLLVDEQERAEKIQKNEVTLTRLRSALLEVLTQQTGESLVTVPGKEALKKALAERADALLQDTKVTDVLFSDFVVQF